MMDGAARLMDGKPWQAYLPRFLRVLWIPWGPYCGKCVFRDADMDAGTQMWGYCHHDKVHDGDDGVFLLWDGCKECGDRWERVHDPREAS